MTCALMRAGHEVINLASGQAFTYLRQRLPQVHSIPGLHIAYTNNRVDLRRTLAGNLPLLRRRATIGRELAGQLRGFQPDYAIVDFEPWLPLAARHLGIPFLSVDHQHVIPHLKPRVPLSCWLEHWAARAVVRLTHQGEQANLVTSFFHPDPPHPARTHFLPPILREEVRALTATNAGHVLVYQTSATFGRLPEVLKRLPFEFRIYAFDRRGRDGNLVFHPRCAPSFLEDLAGADWVLTNGGYTLISEALHFGKPVFSVPIAGQFEQWINAHFLDRLGFGRHCPTRAFGEAALWRFSAERETLRANLRGRNFCGNDLAVQWIQHYLRGGTGREMCGGAAAPAPAL